jgi:sigma-54-specific transcriptional regulator
MSDLHPNTLLAFPPPVQNSASLAGRAPVVSDPHSQALYERLSRIAASGASVVIAGETGTGKELAARYLHDRSGLTGPFVAVNCGAFSDTLAEAELFGHEAGAFTGAQHARAGWFETAHGGTLFLDEIGEMPLGLQVKLLRVLQEGQIVRLGSRRPVNVKVRIIAASNRDLHAAVESGLFRNDLYYRLQVASVQLLPLRERPRDILPLVQHFLDVHRRRLGVERPRLSTAAEQALLDYDWPGNVRELENVVHSALITAADGLLDNSDLCLTKRPARPRTVSAAEDASETMGRALRRLLESDLADVYEKVERLIMTTAFDHCDGNTFRTAKRLGVSRNMVRAQVQRFGLLAPDFMKA